MKKEVVGYKCFNKDHTNRYGMEFIEGRTYTSFGDVSFGNNSTGGYHMCRNMEDTFRYFPANEEEVAVAKVVGKGTIIKRDDEYNAFYDMYSVEKLLIEKFLEREEIINYFLDQIEPRVCRFIQLFKLTDEEIKLFQDRYYNNPCIINYIEYYQLRNKEAFNRKVYTKEMRHE